MSAALFASSFRQGLRGLANYALGMVIYLWFFIWIYPSFAGSKALTTILQQMPAGLLRVFGYSLGVTQLSGFLAGEFYSLLYLLILAVYAIFTGTRLMAHLIDTRVMGYLLATPVSRRRVACTQALVLLTGVLAIGAVTTAGGLLGAAWLAPHAKIAFWPFVRLNLVGTLVFEVVAAYSFLFSALAPDERVAMSLSAFVTLVLYGLHVVADLGSRAAWAAHLSLFTVFNAPQLIAGHGPVLADVIGLAAASILLVAAAVLGFERRQLIL